MKHLFTVLAFGSSAIASAQLINGGFEDGLNGWEVQGYSNLDPVSLTTEVPPGGGVQSIGISINGFDISSENRVIQLLGDLSPGTTVQFGGWMRALVGGAVLETSPSISLCTCDGAGYSTPIGPELFHGDATYLWTYHEGSMTITSSPPPGSVHCLKLGGGVVYQNLSFQAWFDDIFFQMDPSTGIADMSSASEPHFRPNPAMDKLWVDLQEVPISISAMDATGRSLTLQNFQHTSRTLELDVSTLPSGVNVLRITTRSGSHTVRFIKA